MDNANHVVALSGGKDSTAMALELGRREPRDYIYVCTPTGRELPEMEAHWQKLEKLLGQPLLRLGGPTVLDDLIVKQNALPNWRQRWCTRIVKIDAYAAFMRTLTESGPVVAYVGLRADEATREGVTYGFIPGVVTRWPLREWGWSLRDVRGFLEKQDIRIPKRTDCDYCFFQRLIEWWELWNEHPQRFAEAELHEARTGYTFRSPGRDTWPAALKDLRVEFESGRIPKDTRSALKEAQCRVCSL
jgi:3'-phosphoadenosine 5'-phosphosulfate sulfotransferase (PAPS reductase)/FAD synthetase